MKYALIGAAGYIAPRHMDAITHVGGELVLACDTSDSVGVLDSYAPACEFTTSPVDFWSCLHKADTLVICTPNCTHSAFAMRAAAQNIQVIVEKPMTLFDEPIPAVFDHLITPIAQLRYAPTLLQLKERANTKPNRHYDVTVTYNTFRGPWYDQSWKADLDKSGGLLMNLGIHLFDLCHWIWGDLERVVSHTEEDRRSTGQVELEHATVRWALSTQGKTKRVMTVNGVELDLSKGMTQLHRQVYEDHENGMRACTPEQARTAIRTIQQVNRYSA